MKNPQLTSHSMVKDNAFPLRSGTGQGCLLLPTVSNNIFRVIARAIRQENEVKVI